MREIPHPVVYTSRELDDRFNVVDGVTHPVRTRSECCRDIRGDRQSVSAQPLQERRGSIRGANGGAVEWWNEQVCHVGINALRGAEAKGQSRQFPLRYLCHLCPLSCKDCLTAGGNLPPHNSRSRYRSSMPGRSYRLDNRGHSRPGSHWLEIRRPGNTH